MLTVEELKEAGFDVETIEIARKVHGPSGYPQPDQTYRLHYEAYSTSIEEPYFWVLHYLRYYGGYPNVDKITDIFSASENSAFFGNAQQRLGLQQDKISQFLATIGKMVKELFQLVRELRILDERLGYYADSYTNSKSAESAEITLKGIWVDMVEQGAKNPASVYGMAREVQFTTLPDLFFSIHPQKQEDVDTVAEEKAGQFNRKVREVLKRKLRSFLAWKEHTYEEVKNRRIFTLRYLRQHYEVIKMYVTWVKPYLKNVQRLQLDQQKNDRPDLVIAFESSMIEIEILAHKKSGKVNNCILAHFLYRTRPEMNYQQEGYNRGPIHIGRVEMDFRSYAWTDDEIKKYKKLREKEDLKLLGVVDGSVRAALDALGDELERYLEEAGDDEVTQRRKDREQKEKEKKNKKQQSNMLDPFTAAFKGIGELFAPLTPSKKEGGEKKVSKLDQYNLNKAKGKAGGDATKTMWDVYHHYKKHHSMLSW